MPSSLLNRLRMRDYRLTAQRRIVAEVLEGDNLHLTADQVHQRATERLPEISRATVYNTLRELADKGEILEVNLDGRSMRYDPNIEPAHHHLICDSCGVIYDVQHGVHAPELTAAERKGLEVERAEIIYHGVCTECRTAGDGALSPTEHT